MTEAHRLIIIGSGPAGYAAATYAARAKLEPLMFAGEKNGGQLMLTTEIENYPGFPKGILGPQLMTDMRVQAERFGATIVDQDVIEVDFQHPLLKIKVGEETHLSEAVIIATGAESVRLEAPGEADYTGRGVSYCAVCDAAFYRDKKVYVVGGGDAAMEDTLALTRFAREITLIHRRDSLRASKIMQHRVLTDHKDKVSVMWNTQVTEVKGDGKKVTSIVVKNLVDGKTGELPAEGVFVAIGHKPATGFLRDHVELDDKGYVVTGMGLSAQGLALAQKRINENGLVNFPTMTSVQGVFAAGDNVDFRYRQAASAAGYGVMAALDAEWWLE